MRVCFMGTPAPAVPVLQRLIESNHEVVLVVTQTSKPTGRGKKIVDPPIKELADSHGIMVLQPRNLTREALADKIKELKIDIGVVVAYGKILPDAVISAPLFGCLNIHTSLLPEYRGAAPVQRALMEGRDETGVTIMQVVTKLDAGPIISQQKLEILPDDNALSVMSMLCAMGADMMVRVLDEIEETGQIESIPQDDSLATYAPKIEKSEGWVNWSDTSDEIMFRLRGLSPWPGLLTLIDGKKLQIVQAEPLTFAEAESMEADDGMAPGYITAVSKKLGPLVRTGDGHLLLRRLKLEGKKEVDSSAFLNGFPIEPGTELTRPEPD